MKKSSARLFAASIMAIAGLLLHVQPAQAMLINGDFSAGFDNWTSERIDSFTFVADNVQTAPEFILPGGGLASLANNFDFFEVSLFQTFTLDANSGLLSFDYAWTMTDPGTDIATIILSDGAADFDLFALAGIDPSVAMSSGTDVQVDVSTWAGTQVTITALVQDGDFFENDSLSFGNLSIAPRPPSAVPAPGTLVLLLLGGCLLFRARSRRR